MYYIFRMPGEELLHVLPLEANWIKFKEKHPDAELIRTEPIDEDRSFWYTYSHLGQPRTTARMTEREMREFFQSRVGMAVHDVNP